MNVNVSFYNALTAASTRASINGLVPHLAIITSADENSFLKDIYSTNDAWIGHSDENTEGTFRAVAGPETGSTLSFSSWASGEPNNVYDEDCVEFNGGAWNDFICDWRMGFIVEYDCPGVLIPGAYGCLCKSCAWSLSISGGFFVFFVYQIFNLPLTTPPHSAWIQRPVLRYFAWSNKLL